MTRQRREKEKENYKEEKQSKRNKRLFLGGRFSVFILSQTWSLKRMCSCAVRNLITTWSSRDSNSTTSFRSQIINIIPHRHQALRRHSNVKSIHNSVTYMMMMMMMMMMDELTLTWHIVLRLQGYVTVKKESRNSRRVS